MPLGIKLQWRLRSGTDGTEANVGSRYEGRWSSSQVARNPPETRRCGRNAPFAPVALRIKRAPRANKSLKNARGEAFDQWEEDMAIQVPRDFRRVIVVASVGNIIGQC